MIKLKPILLYPTLKRVETRYASIIADADQDPAFKAIAKKLAKTTERALLYLQELDMAGELIELVDSEKIQLPSQGNFFKLYTASRDRCNCDAFEKGRNICKHRIVADAVEHYLRGGDAWRL